MLYHLGDRFLVEGIEAKVAYINHGEAWLTPSHEGDYFRGQPVLAGLAFIRLTENGRISDTGKKAIPIVNKECQAV